MASSLVRSHVHPHAHRRLWLKGSSSWFLLSLSEACSAHSLHRLGELVKGVGTRVDTQPQLRRKSGLMGPWLDRFRQDSPGGVPFPLADPSTQESTPHATQSTREPMKPAPRERS
jgi:hypothetical protein